VQNCAKGSSKRHAVRAIAHSFLLATDATGTLVQQTGQCRRAHFFVTIADTEYVFFDFAARHTQDTVKQLFHGFGGYLQADASSV
jgi:transposase